MQSAARMLKAELIRTPVAGSIDKVSKRIRQNMAKHGSMTVGVHEDSHDYDDGTRAVDVAAFNELGTKNIPKRPFIKRSLLASNGEFSKRFELAAGNGDRILSATAFRSAMAASGNWLIDNMVMLVESNQIKLKANAPITQDIKGGNTPVIDTSFLLQQIDWKFPKAGQP